MEVLAWTAIGLFGAALLLRLSVEHLDPSDAEQAKGLAARQRLLRSIV